MLPGEGAAHDDALHRLGHVEPGTRQWRVERQNAVLEQPAHHGIGQVPSQIVPDQDQTQGGSGLGAFIGPPPVLPGEQQGVIVWQGNAQREGFLVQLIKDALHLVLHPRMQHRIGGREHPFGSEQAAGRVKEGQQFGRAPAYVLVGLHARFAFRVPVFSWLGNSLIPSRFILAPQRQSCRFRVLVG